MIENNNISNNYFWLNQPKFHIQNNKIHLITSSGTDFWQKTHYNIEHDNGHCLLTKIQHDFSLCVKSMFYPKVQYDQCGLIIKIDSNNWIKTSIEYETENHSYLGSVVTNLGYSDWARIEVDSKIKMMWYRIQSKGNDFLIEYSENGALWKQLRITHLLLKFNELHVGIYACSPLNSSFEAIFENLILEKSHW